MESNLDNGPIRRWDWEGLRHDIAAHGVRNSLLLAPMPTASTSQILGNNECFEPYTSNIYVRRVLSGEFTVVNTHLLHDLNRLGLWNPYVKNELVRGRTKLREHCSSLLACSAEASQQGEAGSPGSCLRWSVDLRRLPMWLRPGGRGAARRSIGMVFLRTEAIHVFIVEQFARALACWLACL